MRRETDSERERKGERERESVCVCVCVQGGCRVFAFRVVAEEER